MIVTVHGKGSFVAEANRNLLREERQKEVEADLEECDPERTVRRPF